MSSSAGNKKDARKGHASDIPQIEWIIGAIGLLIVLSAVGLLMYEAIGGDKSPPDVKLTVETMEQLRNGYLVKVRAVNEGGEPAARVAIEVELLNDGEIVESGETQFEYLPAHSKREAGVFFTRDPRQGELRLKARGYEEP
jgi:uncharacterized protein (TIGR02588 family)